MKITNRHIENIAKGEIQSFKNLYDSFYPSVCLFINKIIDSPEEASDLAQEAFIKYWDKRNNFKAIHEVKSYLYSIAKNSSLNYLKSQRVRNDYESSVKNSTTDNESVIDDIIIKEEVYAYLHNAIKTLPDQTRRIVQLSIQGYKNPEISTKLNISINTVKGLKKNAYKNLRVLLKDNVIALLFIYSILHN